MSGFTTPDSALAAAVLRSPAGPERDELAAGFASDLRPLAEARLHQAPDLRRFGDAADLVQAFLAHILERRKLTVLLRPVAAGQPLVPRVRRSFVNFLVSLLRKPAVPASAEPLGTGEGEVDPADRPDPWPDITARVAAQLAAVREAGPALSIDVPLHAVLLLDERVRLTRAIVGAFAPEDGSTVGNQTAADLAEWLADWTDAERAQPLPPHGTSLAGAWAALRQQTGDRPDQADPAAIAGVLGIGRGMWNTWVSRARLRLAQYLGAPRARELFPYWPPGPFQQAAAAEEGDRG
jgi:hypothetical protein